MKPQDIVLAVDLDGTLVKADLLHENVLFAIKNGWRNFFHALLALCKGKAAFKAALAQRRDLDAQRLPYRAEVLDLIQDYRAEGKQVVLVSASNHSLVERVAAHLGCFDGAYGSDDRRNLAGDAKAAFLVEKFGSKGYDYVGDAKVDLPVWKNARRAITVDASPGLKRQVATVSQDARHLDQAATDPSWKPYVKALRPHQWVKNILVFVPLAAAQQFQPENILAVVLAFIAFSLTASSVYILNDLLDLDADRLHPRKRNRPFASGAIPVSQGVLMAAILLAVVVILSLTVLPGEFILVLGLYYALTVAYSFSLKKKMIVDICTLAGLYTLRVIAGGTATGIEISPWLLAFSIFLFLSLAALKRQAELMDGMEAGQQKVAGRNYEVGDLPVVTMIAMSAGFNSVLVLALYFNSPAVTELYGTPLALWAICPILLYWIARLVMMTQRGFMTDDPIVFAMRDRVSLICGAAALACAVAGVVL